MQPARVLLILIRFCRLYILITMELIFSWILTSLSQAQMGPFWP